MRTINPQLPLVGISPRIGERFNSFFIGENHLLVSLARDMAERGSEQQLGIWGAAGVGKSHLLNAVCHAASDCSRTATYLPLSDLIDRAPALLQGLEGVDVIAIDDLERLHARPEWQRELFNLINRVRQQGTSVITASQSNPAALDLLPDLVSRLVWGPVMRLQSPSGDTLADALLARAESLGLTMPVEVVNYLLSHYSRELGRLFTVLDDLNRASLVEQRRPTVPFVRSGLRDNR